MVEVRDQNKEVVYLVGGYLSGNGECVFDCCVSVCSGYSLLYSNLESYPICI